MNDHLLMAYLDDQLSPPERDTLEADLRENATLRQRLEVLRAEREQVTGALAALAPNPLEQPASRRAYHNFRKTVEEQPTMFETLKTSKRAQRIAAGIAVAVVLVGLFALAPVRAFASNVLALFRVDGFAIVEIDPDRIEEIASVIDEDTFYGEPELISGGEEPVEVATLEEAAEIAGFTPLSPEGFGEPEAILVHSQTVGQFTPEVEALREVFTALGLDADLIPAELDDEPFTISMNGGIGQAFGDEEEGFIFMQAIAPEVDAPDGVDVQELGEAMLQFLGMSPAEAASLSEEIDFTSTLVLPVPTGEVDVIKEVEVNGTTGLIMAEDGEWQGEDGYIEGGTTLIWEADGYVYTIGGFGLTEVEVLAIADALN